MLTQTFRPYPDVQLLLRLDEKDAATVEGAHRFARIQLIDQHATHDIVVAGHASTHREHPRIDGDVVVGALQAFLEEQQLHREADVG